MAEQLRRAIALRLVGASGALPPERYLARQFGVGRATVQKAVAILEADGLVERRRGRAGGTFLVRRANEDDDSTHLVEGLRAHRDEILEALAFRLAVEPGGGGGGGRAGAGGGREGKRRAGPAGGPGRDDANFMAHDTEFHLAVGRASGNRFLAEAVERLRLALNDSLAALPDSRAWHSWSNEEHGRVVRALERRDAETARDAMAAHVLHADDAIRALLRSL